MNTNITPDPTVRPLLAPVRRIAAIIALCALVATATATWLSTSPALAAPSAAAAKAAKAAKTKKVAREAEPDDAKPAKNGKAKAKAKGKQTLSGKLNLNTATSDQLQLLPGVGAEKAERVLVWRQKNGSFKRVADLRKVKGFGYKTLKKLEKFLDVKGENTLAAK